MHTQRGSLSMTLLAFTLAGCARCGAADPSTTSDAGTAAEAASDAGEAQILEQAAREQLTAFRSREELEGFFKDMAAARARENERRRGTPASMSESLESASPPSPPSAAEPTAAQESITNTQTAGVDEGGIVKVHGQHLVILRRGRLFTVEIGEHQLVPIDAVDAFGPGIDPNGAWYDEMLIAGDSVVVVGYSYQRGGTELGLFRITAEGQLKHRGTYHLRSNDYYSSRNYASRLIGDKLVFYTPLSLSYQAENPLRSLPAVRKWTPDARDEDFVSIAEPTKIYRPLEPTANLALHSVIVCDLGAAEDQLPCRARGVMGPAGRVFYVSRDAVYLWMSSAQPSSEPGAPRSLLARLPLGLDNDEEPGLLRVRGAPIDQFSFLERGDTLHVLVSGSSQGDGMWNADRSKPSSLALLATKLSRFSTRAEPAPLESYTPLPQVEGYGLQNRFIGDHVLYGTPQYKSLVVHAFADPAAEPKVIATEHGIQRIEAMGAAAVVVGAQDRNLVFSSVALDGAPRLAGAYTRRDAAQSESRSHGFFYKPDDATHGVFGLPIIERTSPGAPHGWTQGSAQLLFVRNKALDLREIGALRSTPGVGQNDGCRASCVDWYGNARPIFLRGRLFALLGYELVEGKLSAGEVSELRRVSFAPEPSTP